MERPKNRPIAALRALLALAKDPDDLPKVFTLIENLPGRTPLRTHAGFRASAAGRRLLATRPDLRARLDDRAALRALPPGTVGRAYVELTERAGISPEGIVEASLAGRQLPRADDEELRWVEERMRDTHDLWHVVTGYGVDVVGEVSLLAFLYAQTRHPAVGLICAFAYLHFVPEVNALMKDAYRRGKTATWLPTARWEDLLERPLDEARRVLGLGTPPAYTPVTTASLRAAGRLPAAAW